MQNIIGRGQTEHCGDTFLTTRHGKLWSGRHSSMSFALSAIASMASNQIHRRLQNGRPNTVN